MDDKIKEVMRLVVKHGERCCEDNEFGHQEREDAIESKLRELVQSEQSLLEALKDIASGEILRSHCTGPHCVEEWGVATADEMASRAAGALSWHKLTKEPQ